MQRNETIRGVGEILRADGSSIGRRAYLLRIGQHVYLEADGRRGKGLLSISGRLELDGEEGVALVRDGNPLTLKIEDGRTLFFRLMDSAGMLKGRGPLRRADDPIVFPLPTKDWGAVVAVGISQRPDDPHPVLLEIDPPIALDQRGPSMTNTKDQTSPDEPSRDAEDAGPVAVEALLSRATDWQRRMNDRELAGGPVNDAEREAVQIMTDLMFCVRLTSDAGKGRGR